MPKLAVRDLTMQFPAVRALDCVSLSFEAGEIHGIIGENGAGKSTLVKILAGLIAPTSGAILDEHGHEIHLKGVRDAFSRGIAMIHQELNLVEDMSVAENIFLGREPMRGMLVDHRRMAEECQAQLDRVGANFGPSAMVGGLSIAERQMVEIAKALSYDASVLIMDEPTAVLSEHEAERLQRIIFQLRDRGASIIYISHRLAEVEVLCDRISVLRDGKFVAEAAKGKFSQSEMASAMVGRPIGDMYPDHLPKNGEESILEAHNISDGIVIHGASLRVGRGEIVGLAGLVGSGRTEVAEIVFGARPLAKGSMSLGGVDFAPSSPSEAARAGVAYVSEDRKGTGLHIDLSVTENTTMANLSAYAKPLLDRKRQRQAADAWIERLGIKVGDPEAPISSLSGGNQQKVAIAKWLETRPRLLLLDEPTRGVDVGAKSEIYALIAKLAEEGLACLVISSEMNELIGLCDRIYVMREGTLVGELGRNDFSEDAIMHLAAGVGVA